jgi:hypothetical protein
MGFFNVKERSEERLLGFQVVCKLMCWLFPVHFGFVRFLLGAIGALVSRWYSNSNPGHHPFTTL